MLTKLNLSHFRNHSKREFVFADTTIIVGPNTTGKTNILESIYYLSRGSSFRAEKEEDVIAENSDFARIDGVVKDERDKQKLSLILAKKNDRFGKRLLVNGIPKRQVDFVSNFYSVLFTPIDVDIITHSPSHRRNYFSSVLYKAYKKYRISLSLYEKALRQRNKMLFDIKDERKNYTALDFEYWNNILIDQGKFIHDERKKLVDHINNADKQIFEFSLFYDHSTVTRERLEKYYEAERGAGITLIGPQRDEFVFQFKESKKPISEFGSRGEQRLTILQTKIIELEFLRIATDANPTLLLDDIFSELDDANIHKVYDILGNQQTILTTTHREFIPNKLLKTGGVEIIELETAS